MTTEMKCTQSTVGGLAPADHMLQKSDLRMFDRKSVYALRVINSILRNQINLDSHLSYLLKLNVSNCKQYDRLELECMHPDR